MNQRHTISAAIMLTLAMGIARAQDTPAPPSSSASTPASSGQQAEPTPGYGQENPPLPVSENPPISGLDLPGLEPHAAPLSYLQPGLHIIQSVDSNVEDTLGGSSTRSVTRALGSLELQRLWSNYKFALDYVGGVGYYDAHGVGFKQVQQLDVDQRINWKRGQLGIRDSFSYLPEGNFGGTYGSLNSEEQLGSSAFGGQNSFTGGTSFGALGQVPRIMNLALVDLTQNLTPKSSITVTGGYDFVHFTQDLSDTATQNPISFIGSHEISAQVGYNRILTPHDQVALVYGYQGFDFSVSGLAFHTHVIQAMWGHRISGRMDFTISAGPQFTAISTACTAETLLEGNPNCTVSQAGDIVGTIPQTRITGAGRLLVRYRFPKTVVNLMAYRYATSGSGFFAGAESNVARLSFHRPLGRVWAAFADLGYARSSRLQPLTQAQQDLHSLCLQDHPDDPGTCPGIAANHYSYGFAGAGVHRMIGHDFRVYASYEFNYLNFDTSICDSTSVDCSRISRRHVGTIGLDWTPRPIRLD